ncbi:MAG: FAD-binding oxidoreductase [Myxococcales bacterium]|nr:FAD-binding oxidoreductase [Myxococcales bacterium]
MTTLSGWGNVPARGRERLSERIERASAGAVLSRGLGRSYGDSSLPPSSEPIVLGTRLADRVLDFDPETGALRAEAGLSLLELNRLMIPRRWFTPVTPGTQFVTLGGMVAADVHGKGHHRAGCFASQHVRALRMRVADGRVLEVSRDQHPDLLLATFGGMGLTGHILEVEFTMRRVASPWIWSESRRVDDLDEFIARLKETSVEWPYQVGIVDGLARGEQLGRGILDYGRWATAEEAGGRPVRFKRRVTVPFSMPAALRQRWSVGLFYSLLVRKHVPRHKRHGLRHFEDFFYPLDTFRRWNRLYGPRGFTQYQCVLPNAAGVSAVRRLLEVMAREGGVPYLAIMKDCGPEGEGMLSFPMAGTSLALDFPITDDTQRLVDRLNELVIREGGRIYLAKDMFTRPEHFAAMEPRLAAWSAVRERWDPEGALRSAQSVRVLGDAP